MDTNRDILNRVLAEKNKEAMMKALERREKKDVFIKVEKEIPSAVRNYVKSHIPKTLTKDEISALIDEVVQRNTPKETVKTVERIIEKPIEKTIIQKVERKDNGEIEALKKELDSLKKQIKERDKDISVQYIGTMIPNYSGQDGTVLTARNGKIQWETGSGGSGMPTNWTWEDDGTALVLKYNGSEAGRWPYP